MYLVRRIESKKREVHPEIRQRKVVSISLVEEEVMGDRWWIASERSRGRLSGLVKEVKVVGRYMSQRLDPILLNGIECLVQSRGKELVTKLYRRRLSPINDRK